MSASVNGISDLAPPNTAPPPHPFHLLHLLSASPPLMQEAGGEGKMMQRDILLVQTLEPSPALAWKLLGGGGPHLGVHRAGPGAAPISRPISAQLTEI